MPVPVHITCVCFCTMTESPSCDRGHTAHKHFLSGLLQEKVSYLRSRALKPPRWSSETELPTSQNSPFHVCTDLKESFSLLPCDLVLILLIGVFSSFIHKCSLPSSFQVSLPVRSLPECHPAWSLLPWVSSFWLQNRMTYHSSPVSFVNCWCNALVFQGSPSLTGLHVIEVIFKCVTGLSNKHLGTNIICEPYMSHPLWNLFLINLIPANWFWSIRVSHPPWCSCSFSYTFCLILTMLLASLTMLQNLKLKDSQFLLFLVICYTSPPGYSWLCVSCSDFLLSCLPPHSSLLWVCSSMFLYFNWCSTTHAPT